MTRRHLATFRSAPALAIGFTTAIATALIGAAPQGTSLPASRHAGAVVISRKAAHPAGRELGRLLFRFVSMPDFINTDIGDTRLRAGNGWDPGDPNSINKYWSRSLDTILDQVAAERPAFVLVAGDLVNGHWLIDNQHTGIFGPTSTIAQRLRAVTTAGDFYYQAYARRMNLFHLTVYPAIGDHDVGDDPWPRGWLKVRAVARYRRAWAEHFTLRHNGDHRFRSHPSGPTADTAYAWRYLDTLFVTVDEFAANRRGVRPTVDPAQLRWLSHVLAQARDRNSGVRHIVVQGHLPVLGSKAPMIPSYHSSRLFLLGGADSAFWRVLHRYHVDVYLAGEMHAYSMRDDGVMQIVHGSTVGDGHENYLVASVYAHRIVFTLKRFSGRTVGTDHLWQMSYARAPAHPVINPDPTVVARWQVP